jgi:hypothetical protein
LRISLRGLLLLMVLACCWLGWLTHRARQQRAAVAWVEKHGGQAYYEYEVKI